MLGFDVQGQDDLTKLLTGLTKALDTVAILDEGSALLFNRIRTRFLQEQDPTGAKWIPSKAALHRAQTGRGGSTLFDIGKLFRSLQLYAVSPTSRAIGTNATSKTGFPYPVVHNFGLAGFPQRQFLGFGNEDTQLMSNLILKRVAAVLIV